MADKKISALLAATTPLAGTEVLPVVQSGTTKKVSVGDLTAGRAVSAKSLTLTGTAATGYQSIDIGGTTTAQNVGAMTNTGGSLAFGIDSSAGGQLAIGGTAYSTQIWCQTNTPLMFGVNNRIKFYIDTSGNWVPLNAGNGINFTANTPAAGMTSQLLNWYEEGTWTPGKGANLTVVGAFSSAGKYTRIGRQVTVYGSLTGATSVAITGGISEMFTGLPFTPADGTSFVITNSSYSAGGFGRTAGTSGYCITTFGAVGTLYFTITYQMA